jgi:cell division protein FtsZ
VGSSSGEKRAAEAAKMAINSPLLEISMNGAKGVLFSIAGGEDVTLFEIDEAAKVITESVDPNAKIIFGTTYTDKLKKNEIQITVIASGFSDIRSSKKTLFQSQNIAPKPSDIKDVVKERETKIDKEKMEQATIIIDDEVTSRGNDEDDWGAVPAFLRRKK